MSSGAVFGIAPGVDFPAAFVDGLLDRYGALDPSDFARIEIYLNTRRMQKRIARLFDDRGTRLLPRLRLVTDIAPPGMLADLPPPPSALARQFELARLVRPLVRSDPRLAPETAVFDLSRSLLRLLDEMHGEGVSGTAFQTIDATDSSEHWQRRKAFLEIVLDYLEHTGDRPPDPELRQRIAVLRRVEAWAQSPPDHPVIIAGSTGSRGTTALLMEAVVQLPGGAVVLPGFDRDMPEAVWQSLDESFAAEDHPQFRFRRLLKTLGLRAADVREWTDRPPPSPSRNRLMSLALRPAPVTDQWMVEGPHLTGIDDALADVTLIEAPGPRIEAAAIALRIRKAVADGQSVALITPDRMLTRRVAAALDRWGIVPDDSGGEPLALSAPGRFLRHTAVLLGGAPRLEDLLIVLKHPLACHGSDALRGLHLIQTRELELFLRRHGQPHVSTGMIRAWAGETSKPDRIAWASWITSILERDGPTGPQPLSRLLDDHLNLAEALACGPEGDGAGRLWDQDAGRKARELMADLATVAAESEEMSPAEYEMLLAGLLADGEAREPRDTTPGVMVWGTLEARVQGADLVILGSLNDGVWPKTPDPDPWLNRQMRADAGLLLPDRQIGLSAHDFQQAVAAPEVVLSRALRDADAETVSSRWLNRLQNLLSGLPDTGAPALARMRARGAQWVSWAEKLDPVPDLAAPVSRPAPRPPIAARPRSLSVTQIQTLIRDPYAIYAREILRLKPLDPLRPRPDARLRGTIVHDIFETFLSEPLPESDEAAIVRLLSVADDVLAANALWPVARRLWLAGLGRVAEGFIRDERRRQAEGTLMKAEGKGLMVFPEVDFQLKAKADRIDRTAAGGYVVYDYKTGTLPSPDVIEHFDKQLLLEAIMAEAGAFESVPAAPVERVAHIGLGRDAKERAILLEDDEKKGWRFALPSVRAQFVKLIRNWDDPSRGYAARRAVEREAFAGDYDHLSRFGEWDGSEPPVAEDLP